MIQTVKKIIVEIYRKKIIEKINRKIRKKVKYRQIDNYLRIVTEIVDSRNSNMIQTVGKNSRKIVKNSRKQKS